MNRNAIVAGLVIALLVGAVAPAAAAPGTDAAGSNVDECKNADQGPGADQGPPGFVGGLVPDFLGDLFSDLPVPGFLKSLVGASGC